MEKEYIFTSFFNVSTDGAPLIDNRRFQSIGVATAKA